MLTDWQQQRTKAKMATSRWKSAAKDLFSARERERESTKIAEDTNKTVNGISTIRIDFRTVTITPKPEVQCSRYKWFRFFLRSRLTIRLLIGPSVCLLVCWSVMIKSNKIQMSISAPATIAQQRFYPASLDFHWTSSWLDILRIQQPFQSQKNIRIRQEMYNVQYLVCYFVVNWFVNYIRSRLDLRKQGQAI